MTKTRKEILGATFWAVAGQGFSLLASLISARLLVPHERGVLATLVLLISLGGLVSSLGTNVAFRSLFPREKVSLRTYRRVSYWLLLVEVPVSVLAIIYVALTVGNQTLSWKVLVVCLLLGVFAFLGSQELDTLNGAGLISKSSLANAIGLSVTALLLLVVSVWSGSIDLVVVLLCYAGGNTARLVACRALLGSASIKTDDHGILPTELVRFGSKYLPFNFGLALVHRIDIPLVTGTLGGTAAGMYSVAGTIVSLPQFFTNSIAQSSLNMAARGTLDRMRFTRNLFVAVAVTVLFAVLAGSLAPWMIPLLFGHEYDEAIVVVKILVCGEVALVPFLVSSRVLAGLQETRIVTSVVVGGLMLLIVGSITLTPVLGLSSVGVVAAGTFFVMSVFVTIEAARILPSAKEQAR